MIQPLLRRLLGASVFGSLLVVGCNHAEHRPTANAIMRPGNSVTMLPGSGPGHSAAASDQGVATPPTDPWPVATATGTPAESAALPPVMVVRERVPDDTAVSAPAKPPEPPHVQEVQPASFVTSTSSPAVSSSSVSREAVHRRSYADITASPSYGHAPDYSWLTGELQLLHPRNTWRLRYASVDEEDRYGGSVTLTEMGPMTSYSSGQCVRVEGSVAKADAHGAGTEYRVSSIQPLSQP